jgi:hypothetical protein
MMGFNPGDWGFVLRCPETMRPPLEALPEI